MATITNSHGEVFKGCFATTNSSASSYGFPVWVDREGQPIMQVGIENPLYRVNLDCDEMRLGLARQIRDRRRELGLTIEWLSRASGVAFANISKIENGGSANCDTMLKIASVLGCRLKFVK